FLTNIDAPGSFTYDISQWNIGEFVSGTINMAQMFKNQTNFNVNLNSWDVSKVSDMSQMFEGTTTFNQNLGDWDISTVS
ncbi:BspA family leucine-rich repeat surface protein, partial [Jejuia spongiicola]